MILIMGTLQGRIIETFFISVTILTLWEYVVGVFLEKVFHTKYWDYSDHKFNFQGRICLTNSIAWGVLGVVFINIINPLINSWISLVPQNILKMVIYSSIIVMIIDAIISIVELNTLKDNLKKIQEMGEEIKKKLNEIKENSKNKVPEKSKITENVELALEELNTKRSKLVNKLYKYVYRLKQAFPAFNTKEITEVLKLKKHKTNDKRRKK